WIITAALLIAGLVGCVLPVLPGHLIIFLGAVAHRLMLGREGSGLEWWSFVVLGVLMVLAQVLEFTASAAGSKWFGGTKWGAWGALLGGLVGMFFVPIGLFAGPLLGAFLFEKAFAKQELKPAVHSGIGSTVGVVAGMGINLLIGLVMIAYMIIDSIWIH
ncbi:MAG: hypothetical protein JWO82_3908, partial [Akkermansiaceae bacterium]|nr:hypothetical protein [Akkermansiaceae bacterium]